MQRTALLQASRLVSRQSAIGALSRCSVGATVSMPGQRYSSSPYQFMGVTTDDKTGIATLTMNKPPVNSMSYEFLSEFTTIVKKLESEKETKGLIVTSGIPKVFTAGLELTELHEPKPERLSSFWRSLQDLCMTLYSSPLATAAAINGACPAGGLVVAMSCDYRVWMEGKHTMGLNEALIGIPPPIWLKNLMQQLIGFRATDSAIQRATMFTTAESLKVGLVDKVVPADDLLSAAHAEVETMLKVPDAGRILAKQVSRKPYLEEFQNTRDADLQMVTGLLSGKSVQQSIGYYLKMLSKSKK